MALSFVSPQVGGASHFLAAAPVIQQPMPAQMAPAPQGPGAGAFCSGLIAGLVGAGASIKKGRSQMAAFDPTKQMGVMPPTGYWDPCGCMKERKGADGFEWKDEETFNKYRVAELKHGRVAMIASVGLIANAFWKFPGFESVPDGLATLQDPQGAAGFGILFILAGYFELNTPKGNYTDPAGLRAMCVDNDHVLASKELANCRMAMMAVVTLWVIEYGTGISPSSQLFNLELGSFLYPAILAAFVGLPLSANSWKEAVNDPAWPFQPQGAVQKKTISMDMPKAAVEAKEPATVQA